MKVNYCLILLFFWLIPVMGATKKTLKPSAAKAKVNESLTYTGCRQKVLVDFKNKRISQKVLSEQLNACSARFPAATLYRDCKSNAFLKFRNNQTLADNAMKYCNLILQASTYDEAATLPVYPIAGQIFYAGVGISNTVPLTQYDLPNFDCSRLQEDALNLAQAEYVLFGNETSLFKNFTSLLPPKAKSEYVDIKNVGRLFVHKKPKASLLFFPSSYCLFSGKVGRTFIDHKIFYLLNSSNKTLTPYFGISFFKPNARQISSKVYAEQLAKRLGPKFAARDKGGRIWLVSEKPISEFDDEGDPKNVCQRPLANTVIGIVMNDPRQKKFPEYFLVANVKNLCEFGEHLPLKQKIR